MDGLMLEGWGLSLLILSPVVRPRGFFCGLVRGQAVGQRRLTPHQPFRRQRFRWSILTDWKPTNVHPGNLHDTRRGRAILRHQQGHALEGDRERQTIGNASRGCVVGDRRCRVGPVSQCQRAPFPTATRSSTVPAVATDQLETLLTERARADLAEQRLADLRAALADMREQRDAWETQAQRLALTAPKQEGLGPKPWWSFRRRAG